MRPLAALSLIALFVWACQSEPQNQPEQAEDLAVEDHASVGHNVVSLVELNLSVVLKATMKQQGVLEAIKVCNASALEITAGLNDSLNVVVERTSQKFRNPANAPSQAEQEILEDFEEMVAKGNPERGHLIESEEGIGYYSMIMTKPLCLTCHGSAEQIMPEVAAVLDSLYPGDLARGYEAGQLRGMWTVKFN